MTTARSARAPKTIPLPPRREAPLSDLHPSPLNPRASYPEAELEALAESILRDGLLQNLVARPRPAGGLDVVADHRVGWQCSGSSSAGRGRPTGPCRLIRAT